MESNTPINREASAANRSKRLDGLLDRLYGYHGEINAPKDINKDIWAAPVRYPEATADSPRYFLHYFQSQALGPTTNECVTTSAVMAMNIMEDRVACGPENGLLQYHASLLIEDFIRDLDAQGIAAWKYRFSTKSPLPGMMPPGGARRAMRRHAQGLRQKYGRSYIVETRSHLKVEDLAQALEEQKIVLLHGAWPKKLSDAKDRFLALLGGMPHTMLLVGYEAGGEMWNLLNPAEPWLNSRTTKYDPHLFRMTTAQLVDFWGRRFLFYPPRFSITTLSEA
jgi:hypothetical protein